MVTTAFVKLWGQIVGAIAWNPEKEIASFEYDPKFDLEKYAVSPIKLPSKNRIYSFPELRNEETFKGLPGLLADSLPDKYGKELINVWLAQNGRPENSLNPVELLCFIGKRGMGALEFEPNVQPDTKSYTLELSGLIETTKMLLQRKENVQLHTTNKMRDTMLDVLKMGTSAGGARPKAIIAYNEQTGEIKSGQALTEAGFEHWLIKFDGVNDSQFGSSTGYGRVEMAYYRMATDFGIEMMECKLIEESDRAHFMTKRFDRNQANQKLHTQTFCALQHYDYQNIYGYSYEQLFQTMRALRLSYAEAEQMFRRMVFNVIARNCDDHTKNFSFLMDQTGKWKLAPAYDICHAYRPGSDWVSQHNLSINGKRKDFVLSDFIAIAEQNSIRNPKKILAECIEIVGNWEKYANQCNVEAQLKEAIQQTLIQEID
jgi:serine/threonine-protein kinase HipA